MFFVLEIERRPQRFAKRLPWDLQRL